MLSIRYFKIGQFHSLLNSIINCIRMKLFTALLYFYTLLTVSSVLYSRVIHGTDPNARCLDGSNPVLYLHQGSQPSNILFYLIGGGSCVQGNLQDSLKACYLRSLTNLGSSNYWPLTFDSKGFGMLDSDDTSNKFANWTKIVITYCDGALFQGNNLNPVQFNGSKLYFRGAVNMRSHLKWADNRFNLSNANKIVLSGGSAGGMGIYLWIDYLRGLVKYPNRVYGIADSAIFMDPATVTSFQTQVYSLIPKPSQPSAAADTTMPVSNLGSNNGLIDQKNTSQSGGTINLSTDSPSSASSSSQSISINANNQKELGSAPILPVDSISQFMTISNADQRPPNTQSLKSLNGKGQDWKCLFAGYASQYLQAKLLWVQAQYDSYVINNVIQAKCLVNQSSGSGYSIKNCSSFQILLLDFYRSTINTQIFPQLLQAGHSLWAIGCLWHVSLADSTIYYSQNQKAPNSGNRLTIKEAVQQFVFNNKVVINIDQDPWPANKQCAF